MNYQWQNCENRIVELLADEATLGLSSSEQDELHGLLATRPRYDMECVQRPAATVLPASFASRPKPMPAA